MEKHRERTQEGQHPKTSRLAEEAMTVCKAEENVPFLPEPSGESSSDWTTSCAEVMGKVNLLLDTFGINTSGFVVQTEEGEGGGEGTKASEVRAQVLSPFQEKKRSRSAKQKRRRNLPDQEREPRFSVEDTNVSSSPSSSSPLPGHAAAKAPLAVSEARIASQSAAIAALQKTVKDKEDVIIGLERSLIQLKSDFKSKNNALLVERSERDRQEMNELRKSHEEAMSKVKESYERELRALREKGAQQSKRSQQLLDKIRKLSADNESMSKERSLALEGNQSVANQVDQLRVRLNMYKGRYKDEVKRNEQHVDTIEKSKCKIRSLAKAEKDLQEKLTAVGKELASVKSTLTKETSLRKKTQHELKSLEVVHAEVKSSLKTFQERFQKHEVQRSKMFGVIKHLKHINGELMSALLAERAAREQTLSMDDTDNPSLLPQAVRLAKEEEDAQVKRKGRKNPPPPEPKGNDASNSAQDTEFYQNLKERYQEAKATYRSLLAREN